MPLLSLDPLHPLLPLVVWAARALTTFNVMVLLWLGLTVLLNAEYRRLGTWLAVGGLLLGGACSALRATTLASVPDEAFLPPDLWWRLCWLPFAGAPYLWSVVLAWHAGRLRTPAEWRGLAGLSLLGSGAFLMLLASRPADLGWARPSPMSSSPDAGPLTLLAFESAPGDGRLALGVYLVFAVLCIGHGLEALFRPGPRDRFMGELAWRRARPWLAATSLATLAFSVVVGIGVTGVRVLSPPVLLDLLGAGALAGQVVLMGQAIVSYEVFTGKALPRRGLARYWRNALILGAGFGGLLAVSLGLPLDHSYRLQLASVVVAVFYALLCWRSFVERERGLEQLRPFVASEHLVEELTQRPAPGPQRPRSTLTPRNASLGVHWTPALRAHGAPQSQWPPLPAPGEGEQESRLPLSRGRESGPGGEGNGPRGSFADPFRALVEGVLGAGVGYLCPVGPLASLVGAPLAHPPGAAPPAPSVLEALVARIGSRRQLCLPLVGTTYGGAAWAVPLWGERSLSGVLLLGDRRDGGLYSQEEMEIARAAGERLIDGRAAGALARRLLLLQRRRLTEDQLLDGRVRRALHDDVLPLLHTALLVLSAGSATGHETSVETEAGNLATRAAGADQAASEEPAALLAEAHRRIAGLLAALPPTLGPDLGRLGLLGALRRVADDLGDELGDVAWRVDPDAERALAMLPPLTAEVLFGAAREALRNAARHARGEDRSRHLRVSVTAVLADELIVQIEDDGIGLAGASGDGASSSGGVSGSGQGLVLHGTLLTVLGGSLVTDGVMGGGTAVTLRVPFDVTPAPPLRRGEESPSGEVS